MITTYPGMESRGAHGGVDAGAAGMVIEGTGAGNVPARLLARSAT